ncbi:MAG: 3-keto-disaccharide hydrolase [Candidatus Binatia bacterium]
MKRLSVIIIGLLVIGFTVSGCSQQMSDRTDAGWITLLDGSNLDHWNRLGNANWRLADGAVQADKGSGHLVSKNSYTDFQIRAEFWASDDANSGIFIRCSNPQKIAAATCYEVNIYDKRPDPSYGTGAIVGVAKVSPMPKAGGRWNTYEITAKGQQLTVTLNGTRTVNVRDGKYARGPITLQYGAGVVKFRKVQIKPL